MKYAIVLITTALLALGAFNVFADNRGYRSRRDVNNHDQHWNISVNFSNGSYRSWNRNSYGYRYGYSRNINRSFYTGSIFGGPFTTGLIGHYAGHNHHYITPRSTYWTGNIIHYNILPVTTFKTTGFRTTGRRSTTSLLKDRVSHCYERSFDHRGNKIRIELSPWQCNF